MNLPDALHFPSVLISKMNSQKNLYGEFLTGNHSSISSRNSSL